MSPQVKEWVVASAIIERADELLLVLNQRRGGGLDWSTPGGVIDADDPSVLAGLTREVEEETGLVVGEWDDLLYAVEAEAIDLGWRMRCEVYRALAFDGELRVDDPDGIVVDAAFVPRVDCADRLGKGLQWVREPLTDWLAEPWVPATARGYHYGVTGRTLREIEVVSVEIR